MRKFIFVVTAALIMCSGLKAQVSYSGPADGSVPNGSAINTESFSKSFDGFSKGFRLFNKFDRVKKYGNTVLYPNGIAANIRLNETRSNSVDDSIFVFSSFQGIADEGSSIPPDPYIAAGPDHVIHCVNSYFRISDKNGTTVKTIDADSWYTNVIQNPGAFDPKVIYDHYSNRWIMAWLHLGSSNSESYYLLSVSDDSDPNGIWFNWALPGNVNGTTIDGNWADYTGIGYDDKAIYLASDQFTFVGDIFQYERIRIVNKSDLYAPSPGVVRWKDLWNITYPGTGIYPYMIRPSRQYGSSDGFYLAVTEPDEISFQKTSVGIYKITDPLGSPQLSGYTVPVGLYTDPENPGQQGGGLGLKIWGSNLMNEPVFRDNYLHITHTVRDNSFCGVKYTVIDLSAQNTFYDAILTIPEKYLFYSALDVNDSGETLLTYSRSGPDEYVSACATFVFPFEGRTSSSIMLQTGRANYIKTFGGGDNRWGDYMGVWLDPADQSFWISTEYVPSRNVWGVWNAGLRPKPFEGIKANFSEMHYDFGDIELPFSSKTDSLIIKNFGDQDLIINSLSMTEPVFHFMIAENLPVNIPCYDSLVVYLHYQPDQPGRISGNLIIETNDLQNPAFAVQLQGRGYEIAPSLSGKIYASGVSSANGGIFILNGNTGSAQLIGESGYSAVTDLSINPASSEIMGLFNSPGLTKIIRINSAGGDAYTYFDLPGDYTALAVSTSGTIFLADNSGTIYQLESEGNPSQVFDASSGIASLEFDPVDASLWFTYITGTDRDAVFRITPDFSGFSKIGNTGTGLPIDDLAFGGDGNIYGIYGLSFQPANLIKINKTDGSSELIGSTGIKGLKGLALNGILSLLDKDEIELPEKFSLDQNYPNPFNPETTISFSIPFKTFVRIELFNPLGSLVKTLLKKELPAGKHKIRFDGENLATGIYIYKVSIPGYSLSKKCLLLK